MLAIQWQQPPSVILNARVQDAQKAVAAAGPMVREALKLLAEYLDFEVR